MPMTPVPPAFRAPDLPVRPLMRAPHQIMLWRELGLLMSLCAAPATRTPNPETIDGRC